MRLEYPIAHPVYPTHDLLPAVEAVLEAESVRTLLDLT